MKLPRILTNPRQYIRENSCEFAVEKPYLSNDNNNCASTIFAIVANGYTVA